MDMLYVVVIDLKQRGRIYAQDKATRVYDSPLPGIFLCSVISGCGTGNIKIMTVAVRLQAACTSKRKN